MSILPPQVKYPFAMLYSDLILQNNSYGESVTRLVKNRESQSKSEIENALAFM